MSLSFTPIRSPAHGGTSASTTDAWPSFFHSVHFSTTAPVAELAGSWIGSVDFLVVGEDRGKKEVNQAPDPDQKVAQSLDYRR